MPITRVLYSSHITELILPAVGDTTDGNYFPTRRIALPSTGASCDETIPLDDVTVLGNLGSAGRIQKDVVGCKSSIKFYLAEAYQKDAFGQNGAYTETNWSNVSAGQNNQILWTAKNRTGGHYAQQMHSLTGRDCEHLYQCALGGYNVRAALYQPAGDDSYNSGGLGNTNWQVDIDDRDPNTAGVCDDAQYTTKATCQGAGTCTGNAAYNGDEPGCSTDIEQCKSCTGCNGGTCGQYQSKTTCEGDGGDWLKVGAATSSAECSQIPSAVWEANTWASANAQWTQDAGFGQGGNDPRIDERTDFVMYGILSSLNLSVSKGGFIEGDLALEGVGRPYLMKDYNDTYDGQPDNDTGAPNNAGNAGQAPAQATDPRLQGREIENYRNTLEPFGGVSCTPIIPSMGHLVVGGRDPVTAGWEESNRFASMKNGGDAPGDVSNQYADQDDIYIYKITQPDFCNGCATSPCSQFTSFATCDADNGDWIDSGECYECNTTPCSQFTTSTTCGDDDGQWLPSANAGVINAMSNSWVPSSIKFSLDMPTEQLTTFGDQGGKAGLDGKQYKFQGAASRMGDITTRNIAENDDFKKSFQVFSKPPFKSSITIEGVNLDVFPSNFSQHGGNYINTVYMGHLVLRMPHNGSATKNNSATAVTTRSISQSVGDIGANFSVTLEANDIHFSDRVSYGHATTQSCRNSINGASVLASNEEKCCDAGGGTWDANQGCSGSSTTWNPAGASAGNARAAFDPFKIYSKPGAGA